MAAFQAKNVHASFLFMGDLNGHHQEWLGFLTMNCPGVVAFNFTTVSCSDQLIIGPSHPCGRTRDLLMTCSCPVQVTVVAVIGSSYHSLLTVVF